MQIIIFRMLNKIPQNDKSTYSSEIFEQAASNSVEIHSTTKKSAVTFNLNTSTISNPSEINTSESNDFKQETIRLLVNMCIDRKNQINNQMKYDRNLMLKVQSN